MKHANILQVMRILQGMHKPLITTHAETYFKIVPTDQPIWIF